NFRAGAVGAPAPQGDHVARGADPGARPDVPRAADAPRRAGGRRGRRRRDALSRRHSPPLEVIGAEPGRGHVSGIYMLVLPQQTLFFADCTVNIDPDAETLVEIASATAEFVSRLGVEPRVALISFSNFGSVRHPAAEKVQSAVRLLQEREPSLQVDGEMQADTAVVERIVAERYPFARLRGPANVLIFPS